MTGPLCSEILGPSMPLYTVFIRIIQLFLEKATNLFFIVDLLSDLKNSKMAK